jgi:hypothetical protein
MAHHKASRVRHDDHGMAAPRSRHLTGKLRQKRRDTLVGTMEEQYGVDFHCRSDMRLNTLRREVGLTGIREVVGAARDAEK